MGGGKRTFLTRLAVPVLTVACRGTLEISLSLSGPQRPHLNKERIGGLACFQL